MIYHGDLIKIKNEFTNSFIKSKELDIKKNFKNQRKINTLILNNNLDFSSFLNYLEINYNLENGLELENKNNKVDSILSIFKIIKYSWVKDEIDWNNKNNLKNNHKKFYKTLENSIENNCVEINQDEIILIQNVVYGQFLGYNKNNNKKLILTNLFNNTVDFLFRIKNKEVKSKEININDLIILHSNNGLKNICIQIKNHKNNIKKEKFDTYLLLEKEIKINEKIGNEEKYNINPKFEYRIKNGRYDNYYSFNYFKLIKIDKKYLLKLKKYNNIFEKITNFYIFLQNWGVIKGSDLKIDNESNLKINEDLWYYDYNATITKVTELQIESKCLFDEIKIILDFISNIEEMDLNNINIKSNNKYIYKIWEYQSNISERKILDLLIYWLKLIYHKLFKSLDIKLLILKGYFNNIDDNKDKYNILKNFNWNKLKNFPQFIAKITLNKLVQLLLKFILICIKNNEKNSIIILEKENINLFYFFMNFHFKECYYILLESAKFYIFDKDNEHEIIDFISKLEVIGETKNNLKDQFLFLNILKKVCTKKNNNSLKKNIQKRIRIQLFNIGTNPQKRGVINFYKCSLRNKIYMRIFKPSKIPLNMILENNPSFFYNLYFFEEDKNKFCLDLNILSTLDEKISIHFINYITSYLSLLREMSDDKSDESLNHIKNIGLNKEWCIYFIKKKEIHPDIKEKVLKIYKKIHINQSKKFTEHDEYSFIFQKIQEINFEKQSFLWLNINNVKNSQNNLFEQETDILLSLIDGKYFNDYSDISINIKKSEYQLICYLKILKTIINFSKKILNWGFNTLDVNLIILDFITKLLDVLLDNDKENVKSNENTDIWYIIILKLAKEKKIFNIYILKIINSIYDILELFQFYKDKIKILLLIKIFKHCNENYLEFNSYQDLIKDILKILSFKKKYKNKKQKSSTNVSELKVVYEIKNKLLEKNNSLLVKSFNIMSMYLEEEDNSKQEIKNHSKIINFSYCLKKKILIKNKIFILMENEFNSKSIILEKLKKIVLFNNYKEIKILKNFDNDESIYNNQIVNNHRLKEQILHILESKDILNIDFAKDNNNNYYLRILELTNILNKINNKFKDRFKNKNLIFKMQKLLINNNFHEIILKIVSINYKKEYHFELMNKIILFFEFLLYDNSHIQKLMIGKFFFFLNLTENKLKTNKLIKYLLNEIKYIYNINYFLNIIIFRIREKLEKIDFENENLDEEYFIIREYLKILNNIVYIFNDNEDLINKINDDFFLIPKIKYLFGPKFLQNYIISQKILNFKNLFKFYTELIHLLIIIFRDNDKINDLLKKFYLVQNLSSLIFEKNLKLELKTLFIKLFYKIKKNKDFENSNFYVNILSIIIELYIKDIFKNLTYFEEKFKNNKFEKKNNQHHTEFINYLSTKKFNSELIINIVKKNKIIKKLTNFKKETLKTDKRDLKNKLRLIEDLKKNNSYDNFWKLLINFSSSIYKNYNIFFILTDIIGLIQKNNLIEHYKYLSLIKTINQIYRIIIFQLMFIYDIFPIKELKYVIKYIFRILYIINNKNPIYVKDIVIKKSYIKEIPDFNILKKNVDDIIKFNNVSEIKNYEDYDFNNLINSLEINFKNEKDINYGLNNILLKYNNLFLFIKIWLKINKYGLLMINFLNFINLHIYKKHEITNELYLNEEILIPKINKLFNKYTDLNKKHNIELLNNLEIDENFEFINNTTDNKSKEFNNENINIDLKKLEISINTSFINKYFDKFIDFFYNLINFKIKKKSDNLIYFLISLEMYKGFNEKSINDIFNIICYYIFYNYRKYSLNNKFIKILLKILKNINNPEILNKTIDILNKFDLINKIYDEFLENNSIDFLNNSLKLNIILLNDNIDFIKLTKNLYFWFNKFKNILNKKIKIDINNDYYFKYCLTILKIMKKKYNIINKNFINFDKELKNNIQKQSFLYLTKFFELIIYCINLNNDWYENLIFLKLLNQFFSLLIIILYNLNGFKIIMPNSIVILIVNKILEKKNYLCSNILNFYYYKMFYKAIKFTKYLIYIINEEEETLLFNSINILNLIKIIKSLYYLYILPLRENKDLKKNLWFSKELDKNLKDKVHLAFDIFIIFTHIKDKWFKNFNKKDFKYIKETKLLKTLTDDIDIFINSIPQEKLIKKYPTYKSNNHKIKILQTNESKDEEEDSNIKININNSKLSIPGSSDIPLKNKLTINKEKENGKDTSNIDQILKKRYTVLNKKDTIMLKKTVEFIKNPLESNVPVEKINNEDEKNNTNINKRTKNKNKIIHLPNNLIISSQESKSPYQNLNSSKNYRNELEQKKTKKLENKDLTNIFEEFYSSIDKSTNYLFDIDYNDLNALINDLIIIFEYNKININNDNKLKTLNEIIENYLIKNQISKSIIILNFMENNLENINLIKNHRKLKYYYINQGLYFFINDKMIRNIKKKFKKKKKEEKQLFLLKNLKFYIFKLKIRKYFLHYKILNLLISNLKFLNIFRFLIPLIINILIIVEDTNLYSPVSFNNYYNIFIYLFSFWHSLELIILLIINYYNTFVKIKIIRKLFLKYKEIIIENKTKNYIKIIFFRQVFNGNNIILLSSLVFNSLAYLYGKVFFSFLLLDLIFNFLINFNKISWNYLVIILNFLGQIFVVFYFITFIYFSYLYDYINEYYNEFYPCKTLYNCFINTIRMNLFDSGQNVYQIEQNFTNTNYIINIIANSMYVFLIYFFGFRFFPVFFINYIDEQRKSKFTKKDDKKNECIFCIYKKISKNVNLNYHLDFEHNYDKVLKFIIYLKEKKKKDLMIDEIILKKLILIHNTEFYKRINLMV